MEKNNKSMKSLVAYEKIRDMIITGKKLPGTRLILADLEQELQIGKVPIREAIMRLDKSGLVKNIPYKGAVVATLPRKKEIVTIFNLRINLETEMTLEACDIIMPADIKKLESLHAAMEKLPENYYGLDREFHAVIYKSANLPHLYSIAEKLILPVDTFLNIQRQQDNDAIRFNRQHREIIDCLKNKDKKKLTHAIKVNIRSGIKQIERRMKRMGHKE